MMSTVTTRLSPVALGLDCAATVHGIAAWLREQVGRVLRRRGVVIGVSGGVDSAVCAALAVEALGPQRVRGLLMPESDSPPDDTARGLEVCRVLGIEPLLEEITPVLAVLGCYRRRDEAVRQLFPEYGSDWRCKIALAEGLLEAERLSYFTLTVQAPDGAVQRRRMPLDVYLGVVAATNMKQRTRKQLEYYHAERRNYAVVGTPNRLEYELGFFVRGGDGLADVKPIAHLYKTQVYALARHLGVPEDVWRRPPETGTYSLPQTQEEFYFGMRPERLDLLLYAVTHGLPDAAVAGALELNEAQVRNVRRDIAAKRRVAGGLKRGALVMREDGVR